jgi:hypothetical protein
MPAEYYSPNARQPSAASSNTISTAPVTGWVRPPVSATNVISPSGGRRRRSRTVKGGFTAEIMGAFAANAHTAIVPLALLGLYSVFGAKKSGNSASMKSNVAKPASSNKTRKSNAKSNAKLNRK